jgi:hypothetical protein
MRIILITAVCFLLLSCTEYAPTFRGNVEFSNTSNTEIWVDDISGAPGIISCGILGQQRTATIVAATVKLPTKATIRWSEGSLSYTNRQTTIYTNTILLVWPTNQLTAQTLRLEFTSNHVWKAAFESRNH